MELVERELMIHRNPFLNVSLMIVGCGCGESGGKEMMMVGKLKAGEECGVVVVVVVVVGGGGEKRMMVGRYND